MEKIIERVFPRPASCVSRLLLCCMACVAAVTAYAIDESVSLPPFVVTGRVIDYDGAGLKSAEVRVRKGNVLLARGNVGSFDADTPCNYAVSVPMSSTDIPTAANVDDRLTFEIDAGSATYSSTNVSIEAAKPGRTLKLNLCAATCTNPYGVSDRYLRDISWDLEDMGLTVDDYDPNADYDGDGVSNYAEYRAGTDAFDPSDAGLKILSWKSVEDNPDVMEATFLPGRNRAYSVMRAAATNDISAFEQRPYQQEREKGAAARNYLITGDEEPQVRAIYLYKEGASSLYRLRLE